MLVDKSSLSTQMHEHQNIKRLGFPRVEDWDNIYRYDQGKFLTEIRNSMIDMDDQTIPQKVKDDIEFTIDMNDGEKHLIEVDVKRNETRVKELKKLRQTKLEESKANDTDFIDSDVLIFYIDALSRPGLARSLPKFYKWLSQFVNGNPDTQAYQFFRYHSVKDNTYLNNHALYYGTMGDFENDTNNVFQFFSDNGFITGLIRDQ